MGNNHLDYLRTVPMFQTCSDKELRPVAKLAETLDFAAGEEIIKQGKTGHEFYILLSGKAEVTRDGVSIATLGPGDYFGELALLDPSPRVATVTMISAGQVLEVTQREFWQLMSDLPILPLKLLQGMARRMHADALASA
jgi:CRP-like cAMP-binding protein